MGFLKMKLTPPAPQHAKKRTLFFLKHPGHKGAKKWLHRMQVSLGKIAFAKFYKKLKKGEKPKLEDVTKEVSEKFLKGGKNG